MDIRPPGRKNSSDRLKWSDINRVVFEASEFTESDSIYLFTNFRSESYLIPADARGADRLWEELLERKLFDPELAIEAALSGGGFYCWPPEPD